MGTEKSPPGVKGNLEKLGCDSLGRRGRDSETSGQQKKQRFLQLSGAKRGKGDQQRSKLFA